MPVGPSSVPSRAHASRPVAAGGWRRGVLGTIVGLAAGALLGTVLPREEADDIPPRDRDGRRR